MAGDLAPAGLSSFAGGRVCDTPRVNPRRLAPLLLAGALALTACGGDDEDGTAVPLTDSTPTTSPPAKPSGKNASPKKLAAAAVLTPADLPGWRREVQTNDQTTDVVELAVKKCAKITPTPYAERNEGFTYKKGGVELSSDADVAATAEQATAELEALGTPAGAQCYRDGLAAVLPVGSKVTVDIEKVTVPGADRTVAYRLYASFSADGTPVLITGYELVAQVGRTMIWLDTGEETETRTYSLAELVDLAAKLVKRVQDVGAS